MPREKSEENKILVRAKFGKAIILVVMAAIGLLLTVICYSIKLKSGGATAEGNPATLWNATYIYSDSTILRNFNTVLAWIFVAVAALVAVAAIISFVKRNNTMYYVAAASNLALDVVLIVLHFIFAILQTAALVLIVINIVLMVAMIALLSAWHHRSKADKLAADEADASPDDEIKPLSAKAAKACRIVILVSQCVAAVAMFSTLFIPVYTHTSGEVVETLCLFQSFRRPYLPIYFHVAFLLMFVGCIAGLLAFVSSLAYYKNRAYYQKSKSFVYGVAFFTLAFFVAGYVLTFILKLLKKDSEIGSALQTLTFIPFAIAMAALLAHSIAMGRRAIDIDEQKLGKAPALKVEPLIYVFLMTAGLFVSLFLNIVVVKTEIDSHTVESVKLTGYKLLTQYTDLAGGFQLVAFLLFAMLLTSSVMALMSMFSLIAKNKDYYGIVKTTAFTNLGFSLIIGLLGVYFKVAQKINEENIHSLLAKYGLENMIEYTYTLKSYSIYVLLICAVVFAIMLFRKQFNLAVVQTDYEMTIKNPQDGLPQTAATSQDDGQQSLSQADAKNVNFDACPAFTELDAKLAQFNADLEMKRQQLFDNFTLPNLVRFVVDYARECRLHLSYSLEDMATFVAGLGASRLTILQGMSGTGKTSLPKIFTEAIMGVCEIVEVESSWRDKNELLGYYNEFSKCFTPKKFTQCLYKARLNSSVPTLIVLDELNLSRIEYYFSDFLSLMEHEPDKRAIKLLNVKLFRTEDGKQIPYQGLTDGHTIKIPQNVWFIGTANRDESTFAISDKVYDRAQTMNFNKRAPKIHSFSEPLAQKFASYDMFINLFEEAKANMQFDAESNATIQKVEKILAPYNISFGNRILNQIEDFVKIYCACFGDKDAVLKEAVEKILLSKVVSKLENKVVESKDVLAAEFDRLGLSACSDFVRKLNED